MIGTKKGSTLLVWGIFLVLYLLPEHTIYGENKVLGFCLHKVFLGFECPGCGMTRAIYAFLHLELMKAIQYNFSILGFIPLVLLQTLDAFGVAAKSKYKSKFIYWGFAVLLVVVYLKRIIAYILL